MIHCFQNDCHQMINFEIYLGLSIAPSDVLARAAPLPSPSRRAPLDMVSNIIRSAIYRNVNQCGQCAVTLILVFIPAQQRVP